METNLGDEPTNAPNLSKRDGYVAFEGGGAKGIAHVGAWRAIEESQLNVRGVCGTSAGAIMAALVAAHYPASKILDVQQKTTLLEHSTLNVELIAHLLGAKQWCLLSRMRNFSAALSGFAKLCRVLWADLREGWTGFLTRPFEWMVRCVWRLIVWWPPLTLLATIVVFCVFPPVGIGAAIGAVVVGGIAYRATRGICSLDELRENIEILLSEHSDQNFGPHDGKLTFHAAKKLGWRPLRIVASNLRTGAIEVFSVEQTPDVEIADAICASICIPIVFKPWEISGAVATAERALVRPTKYVDGGMLSNLPAWVYEEQRAANPESLMLAVKLDDSLPTDQQSVTPKVEASGYFRRVIATALFGAESLSTRVSGDLIELSCRVLKPCASGAMVPVSLLDFDLPFELACALVDEAHRKVASELRETLVEQPKKWDLPLDPIHRAAEQAVLSDPGNTFIPPVGGAARVRTSIAFKPPRFQRTWQLLYQRGFDRCDGDVRLLLPQDFTIIGACIDGAKVGAVAAAYTISDLRELASRGPGVEKQLGLSVWPELTWSLAIPLDRGPGPTDKAVVIIDSNTELADTVNSSDDVIVALNDVVQLCNALYGPQ